METKCLWDIIDKLRDELNIASDGINDLNDVIKDLQSDNVRLHSIITDNGTELNKMDADNKRLVKQVSSNRGSNSNTIQREIDEYMSMNDKCKDARLFLLPIEDFNGDGDWNGDLYWEDGIE